MTKTTPKKLGFFTRLLDETTAAERYRLATEQIVHAERCGFDTAWIAQHHFHEAEGGLPAPFVFLAQAAARTSRIRLGTGIVTLPLELPIRVAEDAAVARPISGGRLEVGRRAGRQPHRLHRLRPRCQRSPQADERQSRADAHRLGRRRAAGRRQALSGEPDLGRSHLAGDLQRRRRTPRRPRRRRPDAVAHPAARRPTRPRHCWPTSRTR